MVYVTWKDEDGEVNIKDCDDIHEAEKFVKENGLSMEENVCEMDWFTNPIFDLDWRNEK